MSENINSESHMICSMTSQTCKCNRLFGAEAHQLKRKYEILILKTMSVWTPCLIFLHVNDVCSFHSLNMHLDTITSLFIQLNAQLDCSRNVKTYTVQSETLTWHCTLYTQITLDKNAATQLN